MRYSLLSETIYFNDRCAMKTPIWLRKLSLVAAIAVVPCATPALAQTPELKTDRFDVEYVPPKEAKHLVIYDMLKKDRFLEKMQAFLAPFRLPQRIMLKVEGCDGVNNAFFWDDAIKVCYEYFEFIWKHTPKMTRQGLTPRDAMIGPTVDVFLHELGHALVEVLDIPFFGREEEVADYIATYILLQFCPDDARRLILGASFIGGSEAMEEQDKAPELRLLADTHSLPAQRYFNRWCMAYGANMELFADAIDVGMLPKSRAERCRYEFRTNDYAFKKLVIPYIDEELHKKVASRNWFVFESTAVAATMNHPPAASAAHPMLDFGKAGPKAARPTLEPGTDGPTAARPTTEPGTDGPKVARPTTEAVKEKPKAARPTPDRPKAARPERPKPPGAY
jgi:hypothetical protein